MIYSTKKKLWSDGKNEDSNNWLKETALFKEIIKLSSGYCLRELKMHVNLFCKSQRQTYAVRYQTFIMGEISITNGNCFVRYHLKLIKYQ